ncbi:hypothetical protein TorRG33x02_117810 [Trema orientale]|uniref:Uncharacterized protein n=1 Tax=Trema orientale TaxID=63057 RepID=A0A2P5F3T3_TREOI|nr:hypothetical protein TorRG33x02_117810 [Trema orientale]
MSSSFSFILNLPPPPPPPPSSNSRPNRASLLQNGKKEPYQPPYIGLIEREKDLRKGVVITGMALVLISPNASAPWIGSMYRLEMGAKQFCG